MKRHFDFRLSGIWYAAALVTIIAIEWTALQLSPRWFWFHYHRIDPVEPVPVGGPIEFISWFERKEGLDMTWSDGLYCDLNDGLGMRWISDQPATKLQGERVTVDQPQNWTYGERVPDEASNCQLRSVGRGHLKYGITKTQVTFSPLFPLE